MIYFGFEYTWPFTKDQILNDGDYIYTEKNRNHSAKLQTIELYQRLINGNQKMNIYLEIMAYSPKLHTGLDMRES